ncbi:MAG: hypothetical protein QOH71_3855 [Blastocatellia bacterium]|jgi:hypothetical protein|nr:hypothetical protein [Blastocatellia bacterium]
MNPLKKSPYVIGLFFILLIAALAFPFAGGAAPEPQTKPQSPNAKSRELPNFDAFGASTKRSAAIAQSDAQAQTQPQSEAGHLVQSEPRLGVPTFLWAAEPGPAGSLAQTSAQTADGSDPESAARSHIGRYSSRYRLSAEDVATARVAAIHDTGKGAIIVKFKQEIAGVEVFRDEINVVMNRNLKLIALSGYLTGATDGVVTATQDFKLDSANALGKALEDLTGSAVNASTLKGVASATKEQNTYQLFTADGSDTAGFSLTEEPARVKKVYYHLIDEFIPAYYVEADVLVPSSGGNTLSASGEAMPIELAYSYVISAVDGRILFRNNLMAEATPNQKPTSESNLLAPGGFTYRVWADPVTGVPYDTPAGNGVHPKLIAFPDGAQAPFVSPNDVTLPNYPFSQNDPWLAPGATETHGNNADAFLNLFSPDGLGNPVTTTPTEPPTGDFRAQITAAGEFLNTHTPDENTASATARQGAIQQLFYDVNFLHDLFYDAGFNEAAGNAQTNNYGRGGLGNDSIKAQAQDFSGFSNANMLTPADGAQPRMRMYVFPSPTSTLGIQAPASIVASPRIGISMSGPQTFDITADIVKATFSNSPSSCTVTNAAALSGQLALFDFDNTDGTGCSFSTRISRITATGATAMIMAYTSGNAGAIANITGFVTTNTKPVATISWNSSTPIKTELTAGNTVTARLHRVPDRDGTVDNQIVFHEWGHYLSNRLIGNGNGLGSNMAGGMGEGWSDFTAMLALTVREDDTATPSNATWNGAYALATYATGAPTGVNHAYYFGIRRYPYSTDMTINPLTFKHVQNGVALPIGPPVAFGQNGASNSEVHNTGEVWANMLWECYAALLRDTQGPAPRLTFAEAQNRMKNYLVASYKITPVSPTFLEARDAVLAAAFAYDVEDGRLLGQAFAKRGAGVNAISPDRSSATNIGVTESFEVGTALSYVSSTLDDSVDNCDADGYLDTTEKGLLKVTLKNTSFQNLFNTTATISSDNPHVSFPNGPTINFGPTQPGQNVIGSLVVAANGVSGIEESNFSITFQDSGSPAVTPVTVNWVERLNVDEIPAASSTDSVEARSTVWTATDNPALPNGATFQWRRTQDAGASNHVWFGPDPYIAADQYLTSPVMTVDGSGSMNLQFDHSWGFEFDGVGNYDGGVVEMSVNGGAYTDIGAPAYNGTILNYSGTLNPLKGRVAFVSNSAGTIHTSLTKAIAPGSTVQIRFRIGSDGGVGSTGWRVDNIAFSGTVETPFGVLVAESVTCHPTPNPTPVVIGLSPSSLPAGTVGTPYSVVLTPSGGTAPYTYTTTPVLLPQGFSSSVVSGNLQISGTPTQAGTLLLTVNATDSASHTSSVNFAITINKGTPTIAWSNPSDIDYPTALSGTQLNATASVPGVLTYTPPATTVLNAGNAQTLSVSFVPTDTTNYNNASKNVSINVLKATPTITWSNPSDITYPTALSSTQLNATASVPGVFTYAPPATAVLNAGNAQTLSVNFVPTDSVNYSNASKDVSINVLKATPTITWSNPADITYPTALSGTQLNATGSVPGVLTYTPTATTVLNAGNAQTLSVNFVPTDATNYSNASKDVSINVQKATPTITWSNPADITYPAALSSTQLNATASVSGVLTYTPPVTTVLNAGNVQTLSVNFVPTDTINYNNASKDVSINVLKATPTITWSNPANITYPTALSGTQLNATASVPGVLTYTPPVTTLLNAGNAQTLSVNFVPTNTTNYNNASQNVSINVLKANQTITFGALSNKPLGSAPFNVSGSASSNLPLSFSIFSGPATINTGIVTLTGVGSVTVRAAQAGDGNYNPASPVDQTFTVTNAPTSVGVISGLNPSTLNQAVTFTATVTSAAGIPTGSVTFKDAANTLGTISLNGSGIATLTTSVLTIGTHAITAEYAGDINNLPVTGALSGGQVVNSPASGVIQFSSAGYSVGEADGSIAITVTRTGNTSAAATVDYVTDDGSLPSVNVPCSTVNGLARERCDFTRAAGTLQFAPGQSTRTFNVLVTDDTYVEGAETLQLVLTNPATGALLGAQTTATLTINDDDIVPASNPVDNAGAFVAQLYHDFLNRTPDSAGLIFWTNQITSCGSDQTCISQRRVNVAAAFFLSIEFQQTGYLVERLYKTAYGSSTGSSTLGGVHALPVPVVRFAEFLPDTQRIGQGVRVGQAGWETALENNKGAFADEFVLRSRFTTVYSAGISAATFVDTLNTNAGNPLSTTERDQLVSDLNGAIKTRAQALRTIAEHPALVAAESNRAFVLMQYFGFMRRNPNDLPDADYTGYDFWLTKLNQFNGNFVNADMVKGFINSAEYRQRFGN